jgi:Holliday junction resolvase
MGRMSRRKGAVIEREIVNKHLELGIPALRVPLSGAARGFKDDVRIEGIGTAEVKARANGNGFAQLEKWLGECDALFLRRDRAEPLVLLPWSTYARLLKGEKKNVG